MVGEVSEGFTFKFVKHRLNTFNYFSFFSCAGVFLFHNLADNLLRFFCLQWNAKIRSELEFEFIFYFPHLNLIKLLLLAQLLVNPSHLLHTCTYYSELYLCNLIDPTNRLYCFFNITNSRWNFYTNAKRHTLLISTFLKLITKLINLN